MFGNTSRELRATVENTQASAANRYSGHGSMRHFNSHLAVFGAASVGALCLSIGDVLNNGHGATTLKIGELLRQHIYPGIENAGLFALVVIVLIACAMCWIYQPQTRIDAFSRGFSVFAILTVAAPAPIDLNAEPGQDLIGAVGNFFFTAALADSPLQLAAIEEATIRLTLHGESRDLSDLNSVITVRHPRTAQIVDRQYIKGNEVSITQPAGRYLVEIEVPGYRRVKTNVTVGSGKADYHVRLKSSVIPLGIQRLYVPDKTQAR